MTLVFGLVPPAIAADPAPPANRLNSPIVDLAVLEPSDTSDPDATPTLLVLDAAPPDQRSAHVSILRRAAIWQPVAETDVDLAGDGLADRWLVDLGDRRFALIATTPTSTPGTGEAVVVAFEVRETGDTAAIVEIGSTRLDRAIEDAGAADVDGSGTAELVLGLRPDFDPGGSCGSSSLLVLDGATVGVRRAFDLPGRLGAGAIGRWDAVPGDDLLVYASPECPPGGSGGARLSAVRLADGTESTVALTSQNVNANPPPLRVDLDGRDRHQAVVWTASGLALVDGSGQKPVVIAPGAVLPLVAGPDAATDGPATRIAWLDAIGLHSALIRRGDDLITVQDRTDAVIGDLDHDRWELLYRATIGDIRGHGLSSAWLGSLSDPDCPDLILPGAIMPCGVTELRSGAAWLATRPVAAMSIEGRRGLLVAAGLGWDPKVGLPPTPSPLAAGPDGRWRHGPSTPFALSEVRASDVAYYQDFPVPAATIDPTAGRDGSTVLPGFTGTRHFASVTPLDDGEEGPAVAPSRFDGLRESPGLDGVVATVRVPVPPGIESGRDGSFVHLPLGDIGRLARLGRTLGGARRPDQRLGRGRVRGRAHRHPRCRRADAQAGGPVHEPRLALRRQPHRSDRAGIDGDLEGIGEMPVDRRGRFRVETRLAPWPQTIRLVATDPAGNASTTELSVIGGVDYRRFPWPLITALALARARRGVSGSWRSVPDGARAGSEATGRGRPRAFDDESAPRSRSCRRAGGLAHP